MTPAQAIKKELKKVFPLVKFSCTYDRFVGGDAVNVDRAGGPEKEVVSRVLKKYVCGDVDSMTDCYEYSNKIEGIIQTKYLSLYRR